MKKICVTGSDGLIGWHFRVFASTMDEIEIVPCNRQQFADDEYLQKAVSESDVVVHFAGMNRGEEDDIFKTNIALAQRIVDACCLLYTSPSPRDLSTSRMPSSA